VRRWVVLAVAVVVTLGSADASARPATPKPAPSAKLPKARHAKMPEGALEAPVDPWREKPRYGAPWKRPSDDPKLRGKPIGGSAFEFFFWLWLLPLGLGAGTLVLERRARVRRPEWEVRSPAGSPDGTNRTQA
jgi:hypothetical protein